MSSLRADIERAMGLRFPGQDGEAIVRFEESMEVPGAAEALMRGLYKDADRVRRWFQTLHQETAAVLDILMPRRSRLRQWAEELPDRPEEAERYLKQTSEQLKQREQSLVDIEQSLIRELQENCLKDLFPIPLNAFGVVSFNEASVKIYLRAIGRLAEVLQMNPEQMRQAVRIHFIFFLLLICGLDLDGMVYERTKDETMGHWIASIYTLRYLKHSTELKNCYIEWTKAWGGKLPPKSMLEDGEAEKIRAATIFWRRQPGLEWEECWRLINQLAGSGRISRYILN